MGLPLRTYRDLVDRLIDLFDLEATTRNTRLVRAAAITAHRELPQRHDWNYYRRGLSLLTSAPYSTGTIAYDHTGGTYERMVTLTSGTWPTWAAAGELVIDSVRYAVRERVSSTIVTLEENSNPGADVAAGETYSIERASYDMPSDFRVLDKCLDITSGREVEVASRTEVDLRRAIYDTTASEPRWVAITASGDALGTKSLVFTPAPSEARSYTILYTAQPAALYTEFYSDGSVTISAGSSTVTGTSTAWTSAHVGTIIRVSSSTTVVPTDEIGSAILGTSNPYTEQRRVLRVASATSLIVDSPFVSAYTGVKHCLSDPIDVEPTAMWTAMLRMAEAELAVQLRSKDLADRQNLATQAIRLAMEHDNSRRVSADSLDGRIAFYVNFEA